MTVGEVETKEHVKKRVKLCSKESSSSTETRSKSSQSWQIMWKRLIKRVIGGITRGVPPSPFLCMISPYKVQCLGEKKVKVRQEVLKWKEWKGDKMGSGYALNSLTSLPIFLPFLPLHAKPYRASCKKQSGHNNNREQREKRPYKEKALKTSIERINLPSLRFKLIR